MMKNAIKAEELVLQYIDKDWNSQKNLEGAAQQSPSEELEQEWQSTQRKKLGLTKNEEGRVRFNVNQCVGYLREICEISNLNGALCIYNRLSGLWECLTNLLLGTLLMVIMNKIVPQSWQSHYEKEVFEGLERSVPRIHGLEMPEDLIPLQNGVYDLKKQQLRSYCPEDMFQSKIPVEYDISKQCPIFRETLQEIFQDDEERMAVMQEIFGNALLNSSKSEKIFFWVGIGSNGKSLLSEVLTALIGNENTSHIPLSQFGERFGLESIIGKALNLSAENELTKTIHTENLKAFASGDTVSIPRKFKTDLTVKQTTTLVFLLNNLPNTGDLSHGFQRKLLIVPFDRVFRSEEMDKQRKTKILPSELSGILNWAIEGAIRLRGQHFEFTDSRKIKEATMQYEHEQNPVKTFFQEVLEEEDGQRISRKELLRAYQSWLQGAGISSRGTDSTQKFWKLLDSAMILAGKPKPKYVKIQGYLHLPNYKIRGGVLPQNSEGFPVLNNNSKMMIKKGK